VPTVAEQTLQTNARSGCDAGPFETLRSAPDGDEIDGVYLAKLRLAAGIVPSPEYLQLTT
jgi:hypothetical protein